MNQSEVASSEIHALLVEDHELQATTMVEILGTAADVSYIVTHVPTLAEARAVLQSKPVDLVLLDLGLPDASGLESLSMLEEFIARVPFVLLTGKKEEALALAALRLGAEDYLVKGEVTRDSLLRALRYAVVRHRGTRELGEVSTRLQKANQRLEQLIYLDPLTEVLNRRGLQDAIDSQVGETGRPGVEVVLLLIDLDDFKQINDTFGMAVGDLALKEVAKRLKEHARTGDFVGRIGGDEFMMIMPGVDRSEVSKIAERIRAAMSASPLRHGELTFDVTLSIATILLDPDSPSVDQILTRAHEYLRESKSEGKNRVTYEKDAFDDTHSRSDAHRDMCTNLASGRYLHTVRQAIIRLSDESVCGWEFLSRYGREEIEMPDHFFRVCTQRKVGTLVDHQCLTSAFDTARKIEEARTFYFNVFPATLIAIPAPHLLHGIPEGPDVTCCIEISEQQILWNPSYLQDAVNALRERGVRIAIDDVGFGNSSLESIVLLQPDVIKLDRSLLRNLTQNDDRIRQLRLYAELARTSDAVVIAEGIETREALEIVSGLGIDYAQGFLWGQPH